MQLEAIPGAQAGRERALLADFGAFGVRTIGDEVHRKPVAAESDRWAHVEIAGEIDLGSQEQEFGSQHSGYSRRCPVLMVGGERLVVTQAMALLVQDHLNSPSPNARAQSDGRSRAGSGDE
jgi:hypothetical protein